VPNSGCIQTYTHVHTLINGEREESREKREKREKRRSFILSIQAYTRININPELGLFFIFAGADLIFNLFQFILTIM
jgi:hypothetical protein